MKSLIPESRLEQITLGTRDLQRYARHLSIPEVGREGQRRLRAAHVLCIGAGGLGSPLLLYLAAAGVGAITIADFDTVDFSNLQRQILHGEDDVGRSKIESAADRLREINPDVSLHLVPERFSAANALSLAAPCDLIIDGTDNFPSRYLSNDLAVLTRKPNIYGSIYRFEGQVSVFAPHLDGPCYRCLFPRPPRPGQVPSCAEGGVLGVLPGIVGSLQATEAIKLILGIGTPLTGRLVHFDALRFRFREIRLKRDPECAMCGEHPSIESLTDLDMSCDTSPDESGENPHEIDVHELRARMEMGSSFVLLDVRPAHEREICSLPHSIGVPLEELEDRLHEFDHTHETIIHCKVGGRSAKALALLKENGFENVCHVKGGITAWAREVDTNIPLY